MDDAQASDIFTVKFSLPSEFRVAIQQCITRATLRLQWFDPDFSCWGIDSTGTTQLLRHFLLARPGSRLQLVCHQSHYLERVALRFMPLLADFSHAIECRVTPRNLRLLTDSFCIGDEQHIVRRFHCDHFRGEVVFNSAEACQISAKRFADIWQESDPGPQPGRAGL